MIIMLTFHNNILCPMQFTSVLTKNDTIIIIIIIASLQVHNLITHCSMLTAMWSLYSNYCEWLYYTASKQKLKI